MIKEEKIDVHISYRNITHYKKLGYDAVLHQNILVNPRDLSNVSHQKITAVCDKCGKEIVIAYYKYLDNENRCGYYGCKKCSNDKREITSMDRFGVTNYAKTDECKDKISKSNMKKYGVKTGYSVYNEDIKKRIKKNEMPELYPRLPEEKFDIIYADPPWHDGGKVQFDKSSTSVDNIDLSKKIFISSSEFKYPTLKTKQMMELPVVDIAKDDCLLFMWSTNPHLSQAIELGTAWGFDYKTVAFIWDKMIHNPGQYTLSNCELCLVFKRGRIPRPRGARNVQQLIRSPRRDHSVNPDDVRLAIERMFPTQDRIELFARGAVNNWMVWGLEAIER